MNIYNLSDTIVACGRVEINITYIKVHWIHNFEDDPIFLYSELDSKRNEIRKIEVYKDGKSGMLVKIKV